jgi:hypothetical protein
MSAIIAQILRIILIFAIPAKLFISRLLRISIVKSLKKVCMSASSLKNDEVRFYFVNQKSIGFDMALSTIDIITRQQMVIVFFC